MGEKLQYDSGRYQTRQLMPLVDSSGISVPGTAASATVLVRLRVPRKITIDEATIVAMTGGTAAGPILALQKSVAGTGAGSTFASHNFGTSADNASAALTVTSTSFDAGDHLLITNLAGTAASTPKATLMLGWLETFPGT